MKTYFQALWNDPAAARKAYATLIGVVVLLAANGLLPDVVWIQYIAAVLTVVTTYAVRNDTPNREKVSR